MQKFLIGPMCVTKEDFEQQLNSCGLKFGYIKRLYEKWKDGDLFTVDELNKTKIDRIEQSLNLGITKIVYRNFRAFQSYVTTEKECMYSEYFTYASKLPESQRFGKSTMILSQVLNLMKYRDFAEKFKPLKFTPHLVEI